MELEAAMLDVLTFLVSFMYATFAAMDVFSHAALTGSIGARLRYELDVVMGGLLGVRSNYAYVEAAVLLFGAAFAALPLVSASLALPGAVGLLVLAAYNGVCVAYDACVGLPKRAFIVITGALTTLLLWRTAHSIPASQALALVAATVPVLAAAVAACVRMRARRAEQESVSVRFRSIIRFCEARKRWEWRPGADAPEGFDEW